MTETSAYLEAIAQAEHWKQIALQAQKERDQAIAACERQAASYAHDRAMFTKREEQHRLALRPEPLPVCDPATCSSKTIAEPCSRMVDGVCVLSGRVQG